MDLVTFSKKIPEYNHILDLFNQIEQLKKTNKHDPVFISVIYSDGSEVKIETLTKEFKQKFKKAIVIDLENQYNQCKKNFETDKGT